MATETIQYLGFLTVTEHARLGLIGGYLVLNHAGRPVEFHCTTPVRANRAQEILYGTTLKPFLYGEQIAQTLINRSKIKPNVILTDVAPVLAVQDFADIPIVLVSSHSKNAPNLKIASSPRDDTDDFNRDEDNHANLEKTGKIKHDPIMGQIDDVPGLVASRWSEKKIAMHPVAVPEIKNHPASETVAKLEIVSCAIDFTEPFERIQLAVEEAQKAA